MFDEKKSPEQRRKFEAKTRDFKTFILHQLCSLLEHFRPRHRRKKKTNGAENSLRKKFEANRPEFSVIESDE